MFNKKSNQINVSHNNDIIRRINVNQTDNINSNNLEKMNKNNHLLINLLQNHLVVMTPITLISKQPVEL